MGAPFANRSVHDRADFTSALDKIADDNAPSAGAGAGAGAGGVLATAADYLHHGARSVADTAHQYTGADDVTTGNKVCTHVLSLRGARPTRV